MLSGQALLEFNEIYKSEFGVELDGEELTKTANTALEIFKVVYRPWELEGISQIGVLGASFRFDSRCRTRKERKDGQ